MMKRFRIREEGELDVNMANVLMLLSRGVDDQTTDLHPQSSGRVFECKTCNRQFPSFQALGGHRASHKMPRLLGDHNGQAQAAVSKPRVHECSICGLEFAIGQALGGHMRRHRASSDQGFSNMAAVAVEAAQVVEEKNGGGDGKKALALDLNMTPMENDAELRLLKFTLGLPVVGCLQ